MLDRLKYKLKESNSKVDVNQDAFVQVSFTDERRLLPVGEINHIVDVGAEFQRERNNSFIYRMKGTVCPLFSNPLMNPVGVESGDSNIKKVDNGLNIFNGDLFIQDQTSSTVNPTTGHEPLTYEESFNQYLVEKDGWFGFTDPDIRKPSFCEHFDIEPIRDRFDLNSNINKNWELTITYPFDSDSGHTVVKGGLLIINAVAVTVGGKPMTALATSVQHGLENGDRVRLTGMSKTTHNKDYTVKRLGLDNGDLEANYFTIDVITTTGAAGGGGRMKKLVSGEESTYYLRKFKKILVNNDYEMYPLGFSKTIFSDMNYQFVINEDIDIEGLVDNLGRPLSELYATFIKTDSSDSSDSKFSFGPVKSGLDLEDLDGNKGGNSSQVKLSNVRQIHDGLPAPLSDFTSHDTLPNEGDLYNDYTTKEWFYGDVVEYNRFTLKETKLADVLHRFNTTNRENTPSSPVVSGPRREGYLYKPHHLFKIREFSLYIEQGDESTGGIPDYAEYMGPNDGRYFWRDLLDIGIWDGEGDFLDYPFTNGAHYIHDNICFMTTRQDPFGGYNLYHEGNTIGPFDPITKLDANGLPFDPPDPRGDAITDNFITKNSQDVC